MKTQDLLWMWVYILLCVNIVYHYIFIYMHVNVFIAVISVLKKNCTRLCECLPTDYKSTISKLQQFVVLSEEQLQQISQHTSSEIINMIIIGLLVEPLQSDVEILKVCDILEGVVTSATSKSFIQNLKYGK